MAKSVQQGAFESVAPKLIEKGLSPLPIKKGEKRPQIRKWQEYCKRLPTEEEMAIWMKDHAECNIGLALGNKVDEDRFLIAVDVDVEDMVDRVRHAIGGSPPAKKGKKGITFFVIASGNVHNQKFVNRSPERQRSGTLVEILASGSQTVMPPSIHPEGMEYQWLTPSLLDADIKSVQPLTDAAIDEITAHAHGRGEHFDALNSMEWMGVGGGGNTHDVCVAAVACMVARQWLDTDIVMRIDRAKREASVRAGEEYNWPESERVIREWIESAREKGMDINSKVKRVPVERMVAESIIHEFNGEEQKLATFQNQTMLYQDGHWKSITTDDLLRIIMHRDRSLSMAQISNIQRLIQIATNVETFGEKGMNRVCLQNGTINLLTGELELHSAHHEIRHQLPFEWDDESPCPLYEQFVNQTFNDDKEVVSTWDEFCGHTLVPDMSFQKLVFLVGPGGTGKSTAASLLRSMHDRHAVSSTPITALHDERLRSMLVGKLLNVSSEQSRLNPIADDYLKKITGGDLIDVRFLYTEPQNVQLTVRFVELANEMPATKDVSDAIRRRLLIFPCPNVADKPDRYLINKLQIERPGILRRWMKGFQRLHARGHFEIPDASKKEVEIYLLENDPVALWINARIDRNSDGSPGNDLYYDYRRWAEATGYAAKDVLHAVAWGRRLTSLGFPSILQRHGKGFIRVRGLKIKEGMEVNI